MQNPNTGIHNILLVPFIKKIKIAIKFYFHTAFRTKISFSSKSNRGNIKEADISQFTNFEATEF